MRRYGISDTALDPMTPWDVSTVPVSQGIPYYLAKDPQPAPGDWQPDWRAGIAASEPIAPPVKPTAPWVMPAIIGALVLVGGYMVWRSS